MNESHPDTRFLYLANGSKITVAGAPDQNDRLVGMTPPPDQDAAPEPTHGRHECFGCGKVETYPLTQEAARGVVKRHAGCKHGARSGVKQRLTAGINLWPKRRK